jgi:hypothetical protein
MAIITPEFCKLFCKEFKKIIKSLEEKFDVRIELGTMSYDPDVNLTTKMTVTVAGADETLFKRHCQMYGLKESDYGKIVNLEGEDFKIVGLEPKRSKFPIALENVRTQRRALTTREMIKDKL